MSTPNYFDQITYLMIETNSSCNLKCSFCNREELVAKGWRKPLNLSLEQFKKILDPFKDCPIDTVKLEGISEPMMHPHFDLLAAELRETFPEAFVIIATNLQYNLEKTPFLSTIPFVDMIYLSIDGTEGLYEEARPGAKWSRLISSLDSIKAMVPARDRQEKLHINFVCTEFNYRCIPDMYALKEEYGLASVRINLAQNWSEDQLNDRNFHPQMRAFLKDYAKDIKGVSTWNYRDCFWPYAGIIVDVEGNVRQCVINTSQDPIANLHTSNIKEVYNESEYYLRLRNKLDNNQAAKSCVNCDYNVLTAPLKDILGDENSAQTARSFVRLK